MTGNPKSRPRHPLAWLLPLLLITLAALVLPAVAHAQATTPTVSSVAITSSPGTDNTYATGDTITVSVTFGEAVTVTGAPYVVLDIGAQPRNFKYSGDGTSATAQLFGYTVLVGDKDTDGVSLLVNSLTLNGGTIQATDDSTNATLTHAAMTFANHKVDTHVTLVSNIGQTDATETFTVSATESATASFTISRDYKYTIKEIVLDVKTASDALAVTVTVSGNTPGGEDVLYGYEYVFSGSAATTGRQIFTLDDPYLQLAEIDGGSLFYPFTYEITISGTGSGTVEIGATASSRQDDGGLGRWGIADPSSGTAIPRFSLHGYRGVNPFIYHAEIISIPEDGTTYRAGERIEVIVVFSTSLQGPIPTEADIWLGTGAEHPRAASLVTEFHESIHYILYAYTVQTGDRDTDGILLGENPLGRNANADLKHLHSSTPVDLTYGAVQLGVDQLVDGSQARTCAEIFCAEVLTEFVEVLAGDEQYRLWEFYLLEYSHRTPPWDEAGESSKVTFGDGTEEHALTLLSNVHPITFIDWCGSDGCTRLTEPFLAASMYPAIPPNAVERLGFVIDGSVFRFTEADSGSGGVSFWWTNSGVTFAEGQTVSLNPNPPKRDVRVVDTMDDG